ncbi:MAG TPA: sensor histidine kinase, partial [Flavobacteriales bacterium]|nr:sensor histidine kinase [Flavobacteriales bacterium]
GSLSLELNAATDEIEADKVHLTNIFYNLLDNARKYSEGSPEVIVRTESDANGVRIKIIDHGIGIAKDALKNIFEKFYRVPTGNVHNVKGFGLGLYYVKVMTEQHGGTISVKSHPGKGSEFELYFPFH